MAYGTDQTRRSKSETGVKILFERIEEVGKQGEQNAETLENIRVLLAAISQALSNGAPTPGDVGSTIAQEPDTVEVANPRDSLPSELRALYDNILENREVVQRYFGEDSEAMARLLKDTEDITRGIEQVKTLMREMGRGSAPEPDMYSGMGVGHITFPEQEYMAEMARDKARSGAGRHERPAPRPMPMQQMRHDDEMDQLDERISIMERASELSEEALKDTIKKVASVGMNINEVLGKGIEAANATCDEAKGLAGAIGGQVASLVFLVRIGCALSGFAALVGLVNLIVLLVR